VENTVSADSARAARATDDAMTQIELLEAAIKAAHDEAWEKLMNSKTDENLAIDAEAEEVSAFLDDDGPERRLGGWMHRAVMGTLPTFTTHQGVYAALPEKE
jgi:hypothetical protein